MRLHTRTYQASLRGHIQSIDASGMGRDLHCLCSAICAKEQDFAIGEPSNQSVVPETERKADRTAAWVDEKKVINVKPKTPVFKAK